MTRPTRTTTPTTVDVREQWRRFSEKGHTLSPKAVLALLDDLADRDAEIATIRRRAGDYHSPHCARLISGSACDCPENAVGLLHRWAKAFAAGSDGLRNAVMGDTEAFLAALSPPATPPEGPPLDVDALLMALIDKHYRALAEVSGDKQWRMELYRLAFEAFAAGMGATPAQPDADEPEEE